MDLQHLNVKLFIHDPQQVDLARVIPVFHSWIQDRAFDELLLDVADYRHVHAGPGVILIGHEANYSLDNAENRLGVRYNRKAVVSGSVQNRLEQATRSALRACQLLEQDARLEGQVRFNGRDIQWSVDDRLLAPNDQATRTALEPEIRAFCAQLFEGEEFSLAYELDPRRLLSVTVSARKPYASEVLFRNLLSFSDAPAGA